MNVYALLKVTSKSCISFSVILVNDTLVRLKDLINNVWFFNLFCPTNKFREPSSVFKQYNPLGIILNFIIPRRVRKKSHNFLLSFQCLLTFFIIKCHGFCKGVMISINNLNQNINPLFRE